MFFILENEDEGANLPRSRTFGAKELTFMTDDYKVAYMSRHLFC